MVKRKVGFHVAFDRGQGDEVQPIRVIVPRDESYDKFLSRLRNVFYGEDFERSLRQWEYVLVNRQYEKSEPLPLTSSNTYYAMLSELLRPNSRWRHAVVRRSHSKNPTIGDIAQGTFHPTHNSPILDAAAPDTSLPDHPQVHDAPQLNLSTVELPPSANASQPNDAVADTPMPDAPTDQATPELPMSTLPSKAWVIYTASATASSRTPSPGPPSKATTRKPGTPSILITSTRRQRMSQPSSPLASTARERDPMQPHLPAISSPLAPSLSQTDGRSLRLGSPIASITSTPTASQLNSLPAPVDSTQSLTQLDSRPLAPGVSTRPPQIEKLSPFNAQSPSKIPSSNALPAVSSQNPPLQLSSMTATAGTTREKSIHPKSPSVESGASIIPIASEQALSATQTIASGQSSPQDPISERETGEPSSPAVKAPPPPAVPPSTSGSTSFPNLAPQLVQRPLELPPRLTSKSTSSVQAPPIKPTLILRPRRALWIISRRHANRGVEYQVHWNNGRNSWEPHDSLYRDYPALIDKFLTGRH